MSTTSSGRQAEAAAAAFLDSKGYKIIEQNWRTRWCEIDIVASKRKVVYFVEVKYRQDNSWGDGLEYITPRKVRQMQFASEFWVASYAWDGEYSLSAIGVATSDYEVVNWIPSIVL